MWPWKAPVVVDSRARLPSPDLTTPEPYTTGRIQTPDIELEGDDPSPRPPPGVITDATERLVAGIR